METLVPRPSEVGKPTGLSFMPPVYFMGRSAMVLGMTLRMRMSIWLCRGVQRGVLDIGFWCLVVTRGQQLPLGEKMMQALAALSASQTGQKLVDRYRTTARVDVIIFVAECVECSQQESIPIGSRLQEGQAT